MSSSISFGEEASALKWNSAASIRWWSLLHDITPIGRCCRTCVSEYCAPYHYDCSTQWVDLRTLEVCGGVVMQCTGTNWHTVVRPMFHCPVCKQNVLTHHSNQTENGEHTVMWWAIPGGNTFGSRPGRYFPRAEAHLLMSSTISCSRRVSSGVRE